MKTQRLCELRAGSRLPLWHIVPYLCSVSRPLGFLLESRNAYAITSTDRNFEQTPQTRQTDTTELSTACDYPVPFLILNDNGTALYALVVATEVAAMPYAAVVQQSLEAREVGPRTVRACEFGYLGRICVCVAEEKQLPHRLHYSAVSSPRGGTARGIPWM